MWFVSYMNCMYEIMMSDIILPEVISNLSKNNNRYKYTKHTPLHHINFKILIPVCNINIKQRFV